MFNEDLHIELVNATRVETFNSENLKQETSNAFTSSVNSVFRIGKTFNDLLIEGFYTTLNDPFSNEFYPLDDKGNFAYMRVNAKDGAFVAGINLEWKSIVTPKIETQLGFTFQKSRYESAQAWGKEVPSISDDFMRTPNRYGYATFIYNPTHHFNATLTFNYTGPMLVPHFGLIPDNFSDPDQKQAVLDAILRGDIISGEILYKSTDFIVADFLVSHDIHFSNEVEMQFYAGIKNIFNQMQRDYDKGEFRDAGYVYGPAQARTINFGIKFGKLF